MAALDAKQLRFKIETEREDDGRWIAEVVQVPGALAYGNTREEAVALASGIALRVLAARMEEEKQSRESIKFACA